MKWKHFAGAALIVGAAVLRFGAPVMPVVLGVAVALLLAMWNARRRAY